MSSLNSLSGLILVLVTIVSASPDTESCPADNNETYSYRGTRNGPRQWNRLFPRDCSGRNQSPIDIDSDYAEYRHLEPLGFNNYQRPIQNATMVNNGHTVQIMPDDNVTRTIDVNGEKYSLTQFHFHWALDDDEGSEHTIDDEAFTMEMHYVHATRDGRIAVVGVFYEVFEKRYRTNEDLQPIVNSLRDVMYKNSSTNLKSSLTLSKLLPEEKSFYRYNGSLTTPNCTEGVIWSVLPEPIKVGKSQMKIFRELFSVTKSQASEDDNGDCLIAPNFRPVQPLNGRPVYYSE